MNPASDKTVAEKLHYVHQDGRQVFKYAVRQTYEASTALLEKHGLTASDISLLVAHQANERILDAAADRLGLPPEKVIKNIDKFGNTTAATIPLALTDAQEQGLLKPGELVLMAAVGAGLTVGSCLFRWTGLKSA